jgi:sialate O-acetylesterase
MVKITAPHALKPQLRAVLLLALSCLATGAQAADDNVTLLAPLFQDHAVLQRDRPIPVWGHAQPGAQVQLDFADQHVTARADRQGDWQAQLPAEKAGGPYTLQVRSGAATQVASDILIGDVWLCSGQSNMELPVRRTLNSDGEIAGAHNDSIRMLRVPQTATPAPQAGFGGPAPWLSATPANVPDFSAACYYFARELQKTEKVPLGLINASLGGSRIEPWLDAAALRKVSGHDEALDVLAQYANDPQTANAQWGELWAKWWRALPDTTKAEPAVSDEPWLPGASTVGWRQAPRAMGDYQQWGVPELAGFNGMLWYRTTIRLTAAQATQAATLWLGNVDETDETWVNGRGIGSSYGGADRHYALPSGLLHTGDNVIVVNALNTYAGGGIIGPASTRALHFADGSSVLLDDAGWEYRKVPLKAGAPPLAPWLSASGMTTLYNGMIAPLGHYALRGALWYQGESNTGEAGSYRQLLEALRNELRARFGADLPLLIVQLANYGAIPTHPVTSGTAELREAQRLVAQEDSHSGLAVTIDIGEYSDIHPANKQELGRRLARAARHVTYGQALAPSGPVPLSARREGDAVVVGFGDISGKLLAYGADDLLGFELCGARPDSCRYAHAEIRNDHEVILHAAVPAATRVRYAWADSPLVNLYDEAGLPAGPFQLDLSATH